MKKLLFSVLMISAVFMLASCGSKSNSGEVAEAEEETMVEFTDPAIQNWDGAWGASPWFDITEYVTAESVTPPTLIPDQKNSVIGYKQISTNVVIKISKKIDTSLFSYKSPFIKTKVQFCDKNGTCLIESFEKKNEQVFSYDAGKTIAETFLTEGKHEREYTDLLPQIKKVRILIGSAVGDKIEE